MNSKLLSLTQRGDTYTGTLRQLEHDTLGVCTYSSFGSAFVWFARVLLLFFASDMTDIGSKSFQCALVSTLENHDDPDNGNYDYYTHYSNYTRNHYYSYY